VRRESFQLSPLPRSSQDLVWFVLGTAGTTGTKWVTSGKNPADGKLFSTKGGVVYRTTLLMISLAKTPGGVSCQVHFSMRFKVPKPCATLRIFARLPKVPLVHWTDKLRTCGPEQPREGDGCSSKKQRKEKAKGEKRLEFFF
jgi:hypothetical protein